MKAIILAGALVAAATASAPAMADIIQLPKSAVQGENVLFNTGLQEGTTVTGHLNQSTSTLVYFTSSQTLRASGGQADITGALNDLTQKKNDTLDINSLTFGLVGGGTFNDVEFNLFKGSATSVNFSVVDDSGQTFNFSNSIGNGGNFFAFRGINGESIRSITFSGVGGGFESLRQVRLIGETRVSPVPEPASWAMMIGGFGLVGGAMRRRRSAAVTFA